MSSSLQIRLSNLAGSLRQGCSLLRIKPFDTTTAEGRARERMRRVALTAGTSIVGKMISMLTPLITTPLVLHYLGNERYGLWMTITAGVGLLAFADLGMGNGLLTAISRAHGEDNREVARRYISTAFFLYLAIVGMLGLLFLGLHGAISWPRVFNVQSPQLHAETAAVVTACVACFLANLPMGVIQRTQMGYQEGYRLNLWVCAGSLASLGALVAAVRAQLSLPWLVVAFTGVPIGVMLLNGLAYFRWQRPYLMPRWNIADLATAKALSRVGLPFFALSILTTIGLYSDNLIAAHALGMSAVTDLSVPARISAILAALPNMITMPMWAANGEALARGEVDWVRRNTLRLVKINLLITVAGGVAFVVFAPAFLRAWIGPEFKTTCTLLLGLSVWPVLFSVAGPLFMVLNAGNQVRAQLAWFAVYTPVSILAKIGLARVLGVAGIPWGTAICYSVLVLAPLALTVRRCLAPPMSSGNPRPTR